MYQVVDTKTHTAVATGFANRQAAKVVRDEKGKGRHIVSRGEKHPRGASNGITKNVSKRWL